MSPESSAVLRVPALPAGWLGRRQRDLGLVSQGREFSQVPLVREAPSEPRLEVAELRLGEGKLATHLLAPRLVAREEPLQGVQDGPRALRLAGELGLPHPLPFEEHLGGTEPVLDDAEGEPPHPAEHEPAGLLDLVRQRIEAPPEDGEELLPRAGNAVDGHRVSLVGPCRLQVGRELGEPRFRGEKSPRAAPARSSGRGTARRRGASSR